MTIATLRKWGAAIAVSLPKKLIATLGLQAGSAVQVKIERETIVLAPARRRYTLAQLEKEQKKLERTTPRTTADKEWIEDAARRREKL